MAESFYFLGEVRKGDKLQIPIDTIGMSWVPNYYDVIDNERKVILKRDQVLEESTDIWGIKWIDFVCQDEFDGPGNSRSLTWYEGRNYTIAIKENKGQYGTDNTNQYLGFFRVACELRQCFLGTCEKDKKFRFMIREENRANMWYDVLDPEDGSGIVTNVHMTGPSSNPGNRIFSGEIDTSSDSYVIGRTYFIRVKDVAADDPHLDTLYSFTILPRVEAELRRLLALHGENLVCDNFSYDQSGNILSLRVRVFETASGAQNATQGVTDPEPGEVAAYTVSQEHNVARNVRSFHQSFLEWVSSTYPGDG